jgi:hypothetical protein
MDSKTMELPVIPPDLELAEGSVFSSAAGRLCEMAATLALICALMIAISMSPTVQTINKGRAISFSIAAFLNLTQDGNLMLQHFRKNFLRGWFTQSISRTVVSA